LKKKTDDNRIEKKRSRLEKYEQRQTHRNKEKVIIIVIVAVIVFFSSQIHHDSIPPVGLSVGGSVGGKDRVGLVVGLHEYSSAQQRTVMKVPLGSPSSGVHWRSGAKMSAEPNWV
jgi:hypothetical protein